jgi:hypothetical protein
LAAGENGLTRPRPAPPLKAPDKKEAALHPTKDNSAAHRDRTPPALQRSTNSCGLISAAPACAGPVARVVPAA